MRHVGHGFFQRHLDFCQRRNRHPQRQFFIKHMVFAHIAVRQHVVAELLAGAQAGAVAQHDPGVRAQHGDMVGDVLGVGRADANVDHGDATAAFAQQVVGGHLRQARRHHAQRIKRLGGQTGAARHNVAGLDKGNVVTVRVGHGRVAQAHELINVELVVGEQHEVLEALGRGAGVVAQPLQRVVDARGRKERQRLRLARARLVRAVGNAVVHGAQVGQVEHIAHQHAALGAHRAFDVVVFGK